MAEDPHKTVTCSRKVKMASETIQIAGDESFLRCHGEHGFVGLFYSIPEGSLAFSPDSNAGDGNQPG